ncbi:T9SS type A sorting domain-containing protein [Hymenobacter yonginensis]|uniref:T9SS type A sorting domain-containing protein n=1 Tax=Hymenobacter yonginensis TaxID=748197 RepID=A0ABY7PMA7_9BACT|nr:T9SS type A sorting domain-containing protein [Hymenobacter yonginensis]WBO84378.1 T9SS type A sorting domain-containing protein [Hymenobacter yonginensis]
MAQTLDPSFALNDVWLAGFVKDIAVQPDGKRIILGGFNRAEGQTASNLVRYNADGTLDQAFLLNVRSYVWVPERLIILRSGKLLVQVSGTAELIPGASRRYLVRLNADGTLDTSFNIGSGPNTTLPIPGRNGVLLEQPDGRVLVGGVFTSFNGQPANQLVRLLESGATDTNFSPPLLSTSGRINHLILQPDGSIVVGGFFVVAGRNLVNLIRLLPNGTLDTGFQYVSPPGFIHAVVQQLDGKLLISHGYYVARYSANGAYDNSFLNPTLTLGGIVSLLLPHADGSVYVGVPANNGTGQPVTGLARLNSTGTLDPSFSLPPALASRSWTASVLVQLADGKLLVTSPNILYPSGNLLKASRLMVLEASGALSTVFTPEILTPGIVRSLALQPTGEVLLGGTFTKVGERAAGNVARLRPDGQLDTAFVRQSALDGTVHKIMRQSAGGIVVGGNFGRVGQTNTRSTIRLTTAGQLDQSFAYQPWNYASFGADLTLNDQIVVYGYRNGNNNLATLYRLQADGTLDNTFSVVTTSSINEVDQFKVLSDGRIMASMVDAAGNAELVRLLSSGTRDASFIPVAVGASGSETIAALGADAQNRTIAATYNNSTQQYRIVRYSLAGNAADTGFVSPLGPDDYVYTFVPQPNDRMLLVGDFRTGNVSTAVRRLLPAGQADTSFNGDFLSGVGYTGIIQSDGKLLIGGTRLGGSAGVVRLTAPNVLHITSKHAATRVDAWPVPAHHELHVSLDVAAHPQSIRLIDSMGRIVYKQPAHQAQLTLDIRHLPVGIYLLRVDYAAGPVTRRVVLE